MAGFSELVVCPDEEHPIPEVRVRWNDDGTVDIRFPHQRVLWVTKMYLRVRRSMPVITVERPPEEDDQAGS